MSEFPFVNGCAKPPCSLHFARQAPSLPLLLLPVATVNVCLHPFQCRGWGSRMATSPTSASLFSLRWIEVWILNKQTCLYLQDPVKEMAALQLLQSHGNVEELEEAMADGTTLYKVTPWYEGGELFDLAPMPEHSAKAVFAQLLDALDFIHSRGAYPTFLSRYFRRSHPKCSSRGGAVCSPAC